MNENELKMAAAESAVALVTDGMIVGLGSGSTATFAVDALGRRVRQGLRILGVPTSERTAAQARSLGIPLSSLDDEPHIDMTIDGADQVEEGSLNLIKGYGGALLREKIVASASKRLVIIIHDRKLVSRLAINDPVPVEVVPFGWHLTARRLSNLGATPSLRRGPDGEPYHSDGGNYILDCTFEPGVAAALLAQELDHVVGLVEHGFFIGLTSEVHVASNSGVRVLTKSAGAS
ncbi:MAG TPA: ribose-5-phosphate isomerase RpiA [Bryobacteraceae bacterium]|jgi:ribose 5-phosphate isomerase A|nr:ribose-5-phosphate isomerase RpiA [Bryobacteraceae bacterium]